MKTRKKTPEDINEQFMRIAEYYFYNNDRTNNEVRERIYNKVVKLSKTACRYVDNIYKIACVDQINAMSSEVNDVWCNYGATKEQYTKQ